MTVWILSLQHVSKYDKRPWMVPLFSGSFEVWRDARAAAGSSLPVVQHCLPTSEFVVQNGVFCAMKALSGFRGAPISNSCRRPRCAAIFPAVISRSHEQFISQLWPCTQRWVDSAVITETARVQVIDLYVYFSRTFEALP